MGVYNSKQLYDLPQNGLGRWRQICPFVPYSHEKWRQLIAEGKAPAPVKLDERCTVWRFADVHEWLRDPLNYQAGGSDIRNTLASK